MGVYKTEGLVLRTRELGEADRIVVLLTRDAGKVRAVARGVRRPRSRLVGSIQPFTHGRYMIFEGKNLDTIAQGEICHAFRGLREDLTRMAYASYLAELIDQLVEEQEPVPAVFALGCGAFELLSAAPRAEPVVRAFELKLLAALGYRPQLHHCVSCEEENRERWLFSAREGGLLCTRCAGRDGSAQFVSAGAVAGMRRLLERPLSEAPVFRPGPVVEAELESMLRLYLGERLQNPLRSSAFIKELRMPESSNVADAMRSTT